MHNHSAILSSVDERLNSHADFLGLPDDHRERAHSLAITGIIATVFHLTPAQLFELLRPAFIKYLQSQGMEVH